MGPILIFDKSFLQSLNPDEAVWLDHFFLTNITPLFFIETLADLEKEVGRGRTPEQVVGNLAYKTPDLNSKANVHHRRLLGSDLLGTQRVMGDGRPIIGGAKRVRLGDQHGVLVEQGPEEKALARWQAGKFMDLERQQAKAWRRGLELLSPDRQRELFAGWFGKHRPADLGEVKAAADALIDRGDPGQALFAGMGLLGFNDEAQARVRQRWEAAKRPGVATFAPYFRHVLGVEVFFYLGLSAGLISERHSNHVDLAYLFYLPFCMVFTSNDALHAAAVPLFLRPDQTFVPGTELKADLAALDRHYSDQPAELKERGLYELAPWPPSEGTFLVCRLWDKHMRSDWRELAVRPRAPRNKAREAQLVEKMREQWKGARAAIEDQTPTTDEPDYLMLTRRVPLQKGKWRRFPPEVKPDPEGEETTP